MNLLQVAIALDQLANTLVGGMADETISARAYRSGWTRRQAIINWLFNDPDHCRGAYESEISRKQLPGEYRVVTWKHATMVCTDCLEERRHG